MSQAKPWYTGAFPRQRDKHNPPPIVESEKTGPSKAWRKKYKCKRTKGDHDWGVASIQNTFEYTVESPWGKAYGSFHLLRGDTPKVPIHEMTVRSRVLWRCRKCKKHTLEWLSAGEHKSIFSGKQDHKLDPFRQNRCA